MGETTVVSDDVHGLKEDNSCGSEVSNRISSNNSCSLPTSHTGSNTVSPTHDLNASCDHGDVLHTTDKSDLSESVQGLCVIAGEHNYAHSDKADDVQVSENRDVGVELDLGQTSPASVQEIECQQEVEIGSVWETPLVVESTDDSSSAVGPMCSLGEGGSGTAQKREVEVVDITQEGNMYSSDDNDDITDVTLIDSLISSLTPAPKVTSAKPKKRKTGKYKRR